MKSLCIKENNSEVISFINDKLSKLDLDSLVFNSYKFKIYKNTILHTKTENLDVFYDKVSAILTEAIIKFYQKKLLKRILDYNYFYFNSLEKKEIIQIAENFIESDIITEEDNFFAIYSAVLEYIKTNKALVLEGFVNFRLANYMKNLDYTIDIAVNKFITDKEYIEFVNMLKLYITLTPPKASLIHLVYFGGESILLDKDKKIIPLDDDSFNMKYLSDISFSSNDYALNALLSMPPRKLIIHLMDKSSNDEFINTLKLIFENKYEICSSCELCRLYKFGFN